MEILIRKDKNQTTSTQINNKENTPFTNAPNT
jgi:hypothetical protein